MNENTSVEQGVEAQVTGDLPHLVIKGARVMPSFSDPGSPEEAEWRTYAAGYAAIADGLVRGASSSMHLAVVDRREGDADQGSILLAMDHPAVAAAIGAATGSRLHHLHHLVLLDGPSADGRRPSRAEVAGDLATALADLYPVDATGPLAPGMPAMVRLATMAMLTGEASPPGEGHGSEAVRALAAAVARESARARTRLPADRDALAGSVHACIAKALQSIGGGVRRDGAAPRAA